MKRRVCIITAAHLSTCPRMLKAADALHEVGCAVHVISGSTAPWAQAADLQVKRKRGWDWTAIRYDRTGARCRYLWSGLRFRAFRQAARTLGSQGWPLWAAGRAYARIHSELVTAARRLPHPDFIYGGSGMGLAAAAEAAAFHKIPFGLDLEDYHTAEHVPSRDSELDHALAHRIQRLILSKASVVTAGSDLIAEEYRKNYGVDAVPIHNVFPLPERAPDFAPSPNGILRLYWFSQTIGPGRGLEEALTALGMAEIDAELDLRGRPIPTYLQSLLDFARRTAPRVRVKQLDPASPEAMVECARSYDVGLAIEPGEVLNKRLCNTNKGFTYMLAGLAVVFNDAPGQLAVARELGPGAFVTGLGNLRPLADQFRKWAADPPSLLQAKRASWEAAKTRWHWEHPRERGLLLDLVNRACAG